MAGRRNGEGSAAPWLLAGAAVGIAAGFFLGARLAHVDRRDVERAVRRLARRQPRPAAPGEPVRAARRALRDEPGLAGLTLDVLPVRPGTVELHGWVATRPQRALAMRVVRAVPGLDAVTDCLLVRGEDDQATPRPLTEESAEP